MTGSPTWPTGSVRALLATDAVTAPTREALRARMDAPAVTAPAFLDPHAFATLKAACGRLVPQEGMETVDIAGAIDVRLASGGGDGWRYAALPEDGEAYRQGLAGLDQTAAALSGARFADLDAAAQDAVLSRVDAGDPPGEIWATLPARRWFEELLVEATRVFYAHPLASEEIGYVGMADAPGWTRLGLNEREAREPAPIAR